MTNEEAKKVYELFEYLPQVEQVVLGSMQVESIQGLHDRAEGLVESDNPSVKMIAIRLQQMVEALQKADKLKGKPKERALKKASKRLDAATNTLARLTSEGGGVNGDRFNG